MSDLDFDSLPALIPSGTGEDEREAILDKIAAFWSESPNSRSKHEGRGISILGLNHVRLVDEDRGPIDLRAIVERCSGAHGRINLHRCDVPECDLSGYGIAISFEVSCCRFSGTTQFNSAKFSRSANFFKAEFNEPANFYSVAFSGPAQFGSAKFNGPTDFSSAGFGAPAEFHSANFSEPAQFSSAKFRDGAEFNHAEFRKGAEFNSTEFSGPAKFHSAEFSGPAQFSSAKFSEGAEFSGANYREGAEFESAEFSGRARFCSAEFIERAGFYMAKFHEGADFSNAKFNRSSIFSIAEFRKWTTFGFAEFCGTADFSAVRFSEAARFCSTKFRDRTRFSHAEFSGPAVFDFAEFSTRSGFPAAVFLDEFNARGARFGERAEFDSVTFGYAGPPGRAAERTLELAIFDSHASFSGADLHNVSLRNATLSNANLRNLKYSTESVIRLRVAIWHRWLFRRRRRTRKMLRIRIAGRRPVRAAAIECNRRVAVASTKLNPPVAFHPDGTALDGARLDVVPSDNWTRLRREFTGLNLVLSLAFLAIFVGGYAARAAMWLIVARLGVTGEPAAADFESKWYLVWLLVRFDEWSGRWWIPALALVLIAYNFLNFRVTQKVAALRDEEDRSGYTPTLDEYQPLVARSRRLGFLRRVAYASLIVQAFDIGFTIVPKPDDRAIRERATALSDEAADRTLDGLIDSAQERGSETAADLLRRAQIALQGTPLPDPQSAESSPGPSGGQ